MKRLIRDRLFSLLRRAAAHDEGRAALGEVVRDVAGEVTADPVGPVNDGTPYAELGRATGDVPTRLRDDVVFVTGRFRSGSTLVWNVFRHLPGTTAYYEPFNERRWFDPAGRGERVDGTHRRVEDYWREYDGLEDLGALYDEAWIGRRLCMDERSWDAGMAGYVERLIERAAGRPVLQFNRIDFRLEWFRRRFPNARIVHVFRHPRDQWVSSLVDPACFGPKGGSLEAFGEHDKFYLRAWVRDLQYRFPFLADVWDVHPYRAYYLLWKLSYLFGRRSGDVSLAFEELVERPRDELGRMFGVLGVEVGDWSPIESLFVRPELGKWSRYADDDWFRAHETACEGILDAYLPAAPATGEGRRTPAD